MFYLDAVHFYGQTEDSGRGKLVPSTILTKNLFSRFKPMRYLKEQTKTKKYH